MKEGRDSFRVLGDVVILYAENYINDIEGEKLEDMCEAFLKKGAKKILIDFSGTDLINSIGVSILIGLIEKVRDCKAVVFFSGLKKVNYDIIDLVGITRHIQVFNSEDEALKEFEEPGSDLLV
ncbi:MAG TPA: STAS domain-containing protein [Thermodesulfobacteriota bacterium]|nr:STAS domain-containing protein [Thermodesulfobacteriota bacterium]